jgi:peptide chain release factor 1
MLDDRLAALEQEFEQRQNELADPATSIDPGRLRDVSIRLKELEEVVGAWRGLRAARADLQAARELLDDATGEDRDVLRLEAEDAQARIEDLQARIPALLIPKDPNDGRNVIVEIRGAEGGEEANLFARDLFDMYLRYAANRGWKVEVLSEDASDRDGINEAVFAVRGRDAWARLEHEAGPHRVQRVPVTESKGRIHTSSATVTVLPEAEDVEVAIEPGDLKIDVYRSTGPGGQSVNTTDSAVRITHLPTGIVVAMQDEKSQIQNRAKAMVVLRARLLKAEQDRRAAETATQRRSQVGGGGRSEKVRTYNFRENRVTDHRITLTLHKLDQVLAGDLDALTEALMADKRARQLAGSDGTGSDGTGPGGTGSGGTGSGGTGSGGASGGAGSGGGAPAEGDGERG